MRRSRMHRSSADKQLALTERDLEIFRALDAYRYLRSTYLHAFAGGRSATRFKERLGDLFHEGFLDRPGRQWEFADARSAPTVYELGDGARLVLADVGGCLPARTCLGKTAHRQFQHGLLICDFIASIELAARRDPRLRFIPWGEMLARAPEATRNCDMPLRIPAGVRSVVPDGMFGLEYRREDGRKSYRFFALEADRGTMPVHRSSTARTSYLEKLGGYERVLADRVFHSHLGIPNLLVLTLTSGRSRLDEMLKWMSARGMRQSLLFKSMDAVSLRIPDSGLLGEPWLRAGADPLGIATAN
jgi:Replication-relaxation